MAATLAGLGPLASSASAKDLIFWGNYGAGKISYANLDGSGGGGDLNTSGAPVDGPEGLAIDAAAGRVYWDDYNPGTSEISFANLDGSGGGGTLNTSGTTAVTEGWGLAIDPALGRVYWSNSYGHNLSYANVNNTGGGDVPTTGVTPYGPEGTAIDPAAGRIYWADAAPDNLISYANLDGSGGGQHLSTSGATVNGPSSVALDVGAGRIYWTNQSGNTIAYARLDGSGGGTLTISGATVNQPVGLAIDPVVGKIYWANYTSTGGIFYANLDGSGGGMLATVGATTSYPSFPVLLRAPVGAGNPQISGGSTTGSSLICSQGAWVPDLLGSFLYRVPHSFAYQWTFNGADIVGATSSTYTTPADGSYACRVTASNQAGSTSQTSSAFAVTGVGTPPTTTKPALTSVSQSHRRWRLGNALPHIASARPPVGTTFRFALNESVGVRFAFTQRLPGRRVGSRCVKPTPKNVGKRKCTRSVTRGTLSFSVAAGAHTLRFQGRLSKHKRLPLGRYTLVITATDPAGQIATAKLTFTIVTG